MDSISYYAAIALLSVGLVANPGQAQVIPDGTLPTIVSSPDNRNFAIEGGSQRGANLFHSFSQFSVPTGGAAIFNNAVDVQNIFSRVTGGAASTIDGLIQAKGSANLFLLNPSGIIFGSSASLNIGGSFVSTTANSILFADNVEFSAKDSAPLLTVTAPIGLRLGTEPGAIVVQNSGYAIPTPSFFSPVVDPRLQVLPGKSIVLLGGNLELKGGLLSVSQGRIELGSAAAGLVKLSPVAEGWALNYDNISGFRDLYLSQQSSVDVSGFGGGNVQLVGRNVQLSEGSNVINQNYGFQDSGVIKISASESLVLKGLSRDGLSASTLLTATFNRGQSGDIQIAAEQISLSQNGAIATRTFSDATSGAITIKALGAITISDAASQLNRGSISSTTFTKGKAGNVTIAAGSLQLTNGGLISSTTLGGGDSGDLAINVSDSVVVQGYIPEIETESAITSASLGSGNAGNLTINTGRLIVQDGGTLTSSALAQGNGGDLTINASKSVEVKGDLPQRYSSLTNISTAVEIVPLQNQQFFGLPAVPSGVSGNVIINTPQLTVSERGEITSSNQGIGDAGSVLINSGTISLNKQGKIGAATSSGKGGNVILNSSMLVLRRESDITATAGGNGDGGNLTINSPIILGLENSDVIANAFQGQGGNIQITTEGILGLKFRSQRTFENDITASSEFGVSGTVQVNTIGIDPNTGLTALPVDIVDPSQKIATSCSTKSDSSFVATGRGGIPENPIQSLKSDRTWFDLRTIAEARNEPSMGNVSAPIEATTLVTNAQGQVVLIGEGPMASNPQGVNCSRQ
jgi:filamentous hemagglutinin family protein